MHVTKCTIKNTISPEIMHINYNNVNMVGVYLPAMGTGSWQTFTGPPKELPEFPGGPALNLRPAMHIMRMF